MRFIHFGCWNEFGYKIKSKTKSALTYTLDELKKYTKSNKTDFIIIAGDNYYKSIKQSSHAGDNYYKSIKDSSHDDENYKYFKSGFDGLPKSIKKYLIFGNHDINDQIKLSKPLKDKLYPNLADITTTNCKILNLQQKYGDNSKQKYIVFNDILFHEYNSTLIIMLDSNILNLFNKMNIGCYKYLFDSFEKTNSTTMNELILHQINSIIKLIESKKHIQNYIFVGHHPILACKNSKDKLIVVKNEGLVNLFTNEKIHSLINNKNIFYLCADVHLYQYGLVTINSLNIKQYIVGTGGAHLDNYKENETEFRNVYGIKGLNYKVLDNYNNIHGFLVVDIDTIDSNDIISFKFNPSVNINKTTSIQVSKTTSKQVSKTVSTIENTYLNILQGGYDSTNVEYIDIKK
jgi:hypothetical protein